MKIVLYANIFISSFFWGGNPRKVLERAINKIDELLITKEILNEIEEVLGRPKFHAGINEIEYYIRAIEEIAQKLAIKNKLKQGSRDSTDNKYIECAMAGGADYIISDDTHLLEIGEYGTIRIVTAKEYLEIIR